MKVRIPKQVRISKRRIRIKKLPAFIITYPFIHIIDLLMKTVRNSKY